MEEENTSASATPISCCSFDYLGSRTPTPEPGFGFPRLIPGGDRAFVIQKLRILHEIDLMSDLYDECFHRLQLVLAEIDRLREENLRLAAENLEITSCIEKLEEELAIQGMKNRDDEVKEEGPAMAENSGGGNGENRGGMPKSISIRSNGFLSMKSSPTAGGRKFAGYRGGGADGNRPHRLRLPVSPVREGEEGEGDGEVEVEVYDQGMAKTELCNKWSNMGWCPYGSRCQFAHGLGELRPVIRHPRYKTQLCRMLSGPDGSGCPYGHRCHFRHSLPKDS